jgi:hypothetical protein
MSRNFFDHEDTKAQRLLLGRESGDQVLLQRLSLKLSKKHKQCYCGSQDRCSHA